MSGIRPAGRPTMRVLRAVVVAVLALVPACTIPRDDEPRDIATANRQPLPLSVSGAGESTGSGRIYLASPGEPGRLVLRSVPREEANGPEQALRTLFEGPNRAESEAGITTALPTNNIRLRSTTLLLDSLAVDVTGDLLDLTGERAILAIAQIVATVSEFDNITSVWLRVDGEERSWPDGSGKLNPDSEPLTIFDYAGLIESTQPAYPPIPSNR